MFNLLQDIHQFALRQIDVYLSQARALNTHTHSKSINHFRHKKLNINLKILKSTFGKEGGRGTLK